MPAGRPKEFVEEEVLEKAMDLFWKHGYQGIGLSELLTKTGIARQSLYNTFGNKRDLFILTIEHYRNTRLSQALAVLNGNGSPIKRVKEVVGIFERMALDKDCRGCFVANTLVELGPHDTEIATILKKTLGLLEKGIANSLKSAQEAGELPRTKSPGALSKAIINAMIGMAVSGKLNISRHAMADIYTGTISMLE